MALDATPSIANITFDRLILTADHGFHARDHRMVAPLGWGGSISETAKKIGRKTPFFKRFLAES